MTRKARTADASKQPAAIRQCIGKRRMQGQPDSAVFQLCPERLGCVSEGWIDDLSAWRMTLTYGEDVERQPLVG